jgi:hypothetical protein
LLSAADAALSLPCKGRAAPNTHADSGGPAPQNRAAVPGTVSRPVPILVRSRLRGHSKYGGLTSASGRGQFGTAHGRGGSSGVSSFFRGAAAGVGWTLRWCFGTKPVITETASADLACPPTHRRGVARYTTDGRSGSGRRPIQATGCRGCGPGHPRRTRGPLTAGCHRQGLTPSAPVRPRLAGRPVAQCLTKRVTSKTSLVWSMW